MSDNRVAAAFILPAGPETAQQLLAMAGATSVADIPVGASALISCVWSGAAADGYLSERADLRMLVIFLQETAFYEMMPGGEELLAAFSSACLTLEPSVAFVATRPQQANIDELWRLYGLESEVDPERLAQQRLGLLYVSDPISLSQDSAWFTADRDAVDIDNGTLVWASAGDRRWW